MTPIEICRALLTANVPFDTIPELRDDDVRQEVRERLEQVGCELIYSKSGKCWITRSAGPLPDLDGADSPNSLDVKDRAVLALCWLHLRFLPQENSEVDNNIDQQGLFPDASTAPETPLDVSEIRDQLTSLQLQSINIALGKLKRARFLTERKDQLFAGPMMDALDVVRATEQARRLMMRHERLRRARGGEGVIGDVKGVSNSIADEDGS